MKTKVNLTIDDKVLTSIKAHAASRNTSVSELVEHYFKRITKPARRKSVIQIVEKLGKPAIKVNRDLKEAFYQNQVGRYGF